MAKGEATFIKRKGRKIKTKVKRSNSRNNVKIKQKFNKDGTLKKTVTKFRGKRTVTKPTDKKKDSMQSKFAKKTNKMWNDRLKYSDI